MQLTRRRDIFGPKQIFLPVYSPASVSIPFQKSEWRNCLLKARVYFRREPTLDIILFFAWWRAIEKSIFWLVLKWCHVWLNPGACSITDWSNRNWPCAKRVYSRYRTYTLEPTNCKFFLLGVIASVCSTGGGYTTVANNHTIGKVLVQGRHEASGYW